MNKRFSQSTLVIVISVLTVLILGFFTGYYFRSQNILSAQSDLSAEDIDADFTLFWDAWRVLRDNHINSQESSDQDYVYSAIKGLAATFKDPNTNFFPPVEATQFQENVSGSFGGIGAEIGMKNGLITVIAPLKGNSAEEAGIMAGDYILEIDGTSTENMNVLEAVTIIRGKIDTDVVLNVLREGWPSPKDFTITRKRVELPTLDVTLMEEGSIAHVQIYAFNENLPTAFFNMVAETLVFDSKVKGYVIDLRNNPGGFLEIANHLSGWFLKRGDIIVSEKFKSGPNKDFRASGNEALKDLPIVILINKGSASASEILAGTLRAHNGTKLIGEKSFGKGTVQELLSLKDGSTLKVTIANWVLPDGTILDHDGLEPDIEVLFTEEDIEAEKDVQLEKAVEVLKEEIGL